MSRGILTRGRSSRLKLRCCNFIAEHVVLAPRRTQKGDVQTQVRNSKHLNYLDSRLSLWIFCWTVSLSLLTKLWFFQPLCLEHHHMIRETWFFGFLLPWPLLPVPADSTTLKRVKGHFFDIIVHWIWFKVFFNCHCVHF